MNFGLVAETLNDLAFYNLLNELVEEYNVMAFINQPSRPPVQLEFAYLPQKEIFHLEGA